MATQEEIDEVRSKLGPNSIAEGWTDEQIGAALDAGSSDNTIAREYWESRMAYSSDLADVSESGSSRKLQQIFANKAAMAAYYRGAEQAEDPVIETAGPSFSREIRRV